MNRFDSLNDLYLDYQSLEIDVYAMGVGQNNSIPVNQITDGNNLPWVKENSQSNIWESWGASNRDLFIMDRNNEIVKIINLTNGFDETYIKSIINGIQLEKEDEGL